MGFEKNQPGPVIQPAKKETKINIGTVVGGLLFFVSGDFAIAWMKSRRWLT
jgi:hypothetical protein